MPYSKQAADYVSRLETSHRFLPYPKDHAITSDTCLRCGRPSAAPYHNSWYRPTRKWWERVFSDGAKWLVYGGGWKN